MQATGKMSCGNKDARGDGDFYGLLTDTLFWTLNTDWHRKGFNAGGNSKYNRTNFL
jgi:hypothetical protein